MCFGLKVVFGIVGVVFLGILLFGEMISFVMFGYIVKGIIEGDSDFDIFIFEMIDYYKVGCLFFDKMVKIYFLSWIN